MDGGLGSIGVSSTADCAITLSRKRDSSEGFLRATGRDIEESHFALKWVKESCNWSLIGDVPKEKTLPQAQQQILQILQDEKQPVSTTRIAEIAEKSIVNTINILNRLKDSGFVTKIGHGVWALS